MFLYTQSLVRYLPLKRGRRVVRDNHLPVCSVTCMYSSQLSLCLTRYMCFTLSLCLFCNRHHHGQGSGPEIRNHCLAPQEKRAPGDKISVSDPDSFFTDTDPGLFPQSGSGFRIRIPDPDPGSRQQKNNFSKAKTKFWEKFLFSTQKVSILFLFSTNQVGRVPIILNRELLFGILFKNK